MREKINPFIIVIALAFFLIGTGCSEQPDIAGVRHETDGGKQVRKEVSEKGVKFDGSPDMALVEIAARKFAEMADENRIILIGYGNDTISLPSAVKRMEAFKEQATREGLEIVAEVSPLVAMEGRIPVGEEEELYIMNIVELGIDAGVLRHVLDNYPDVNVIVSLEGFPAEHLGSFTSLRSDKQFFVVDTYSMVNWTSYLQDGFINGIIIYRKNPEWHIISEGSSKEIFDKRFILVTQDNFSDVREQVMIDDF